jgi:hypothetical protein
MKSKILRELRQFKKASQLNSWEIYRALLGRLCQAHTQYLWAKKIGGLIRNQDVQGLVEYADWLSEQKYSDAEQHFSANQFALLIRKYPFPSHLSPYEPEKTGREKWLAAERACALTNSRFRAPLPSLEEKLHKMRGFISYVLGDAPDIRRILLKCDFGPGASIGVHGNATNVARKLASRWSVSPKALNYAYAAIVSNWHTLQFILKSDAQGIYCFDPEIAREQFLGRIRYVQHNKIAFVPKTVKVHRPIAVEPLLNGFVQKGIDLEMREKLARIGIDLSDQSRNQEFAREGSIDDSPEGFVTIDLSSASDSVATEVVRNLLPFDWFRLLANTRSEHYVDGQGRETAYEKFCSMGNGFCFPLETLIFAACCIAVDAGVPAKDFIVYGDDIIVRKRVANEVLSLLGELGFTPNTRKTFLEGPFRESCGSDWFGGEDVRPFTLDFSLDSLESYFKFLNLSERNARSTTFFACTRDWLISRIPPVLRFCRPFDGNPDTGYRVGYDDFTSSEHARWHASLQCWEWMELVVGSVSDKNWTELQDATKSHVYVALRGVESSQPFTIRRKTKTTVRRVAHG